MDCLPLTEELPKLVDEATGGAGVDTVIVAVSGGAGPAVVEDLWPALADGATVHLYGGFLPGNVVRLPGGEAVATHPIRCGARRPVSLPGGRSCTLVGSRGASAGDFQTAVDSGVDLAPLVSHLVSLDATPGAIAELALAGTVNGEPALRVVVDMSLPGHVIKPVGR